MREQLKLLVTLLLILSLSACSSSKHFVKLSYTPNNLPRCSPVKKTLFVTVSDARSNTKNINRVGQAYTGPFNSPTPALSKEPVGQFLAHSIAKSLEDVDVKLTQTKEQADTLLHTVLERFWVNEHAPGTTLEYAEAFIEAVYSLIDQNSQKSIWSKRIKTHFKTPQNLMDATSELDQVAKDATSDNLSYLMNDLSFCNALKTSPHTPPAPVNKLKEATIYDPVPEISDEDELVLD